MEEPVKNQTNQTANEETFGKQLADALIHLVYRFVYFFFILPYGLWKKAVIRMYKQKKEHALDVTAIQSEFPFLSWIKRFVFDFVIDGLTVIIWLLLFIFAIKEGTFSDAFRLMEHSFLDGLIVLLIALYSIYFGPIILAILRDALQLMVVMPVRWLVSFLRRPAKTYDLTHKGNIKNN